MCAMDDSLPRVLFLSVRADFGGGPEHLYQLLRHMPEEWVAYVACPPDFPYYDKYIGLVGKDRVVLLPHRAFTVSAVLELYRFCKKNSITILHSHGRGAGVYARFLSALLRCPCVHTFHSASSKHFGWLKNLLSKYYERFAALFTTVGIAVSESERRDIIEQKLFPEKKLLLIENGVVIPDRPANMPTVPPYQIVHISRFTYQKNSELLLRIFDTLEERGELKDFHFVLLGDGPGRAALEQAFVTRRAMDRVEFTGMVTCPEVHLGNSFCYLSTSRWEGLPLGSLEAMALGVPVIATDTIGNRDATIHGVTGLLYPDGDAEAACELLCDLVADAVLYATMRRGARKAAQERYDVRSMCRKTMDVLSAVAE